MSYILSEVTADDEFPSIVQVEWISYDIPLCTLRPLFFPVFGDGNDAREDAIKESTTRQIGWHRADPTSQWIKVCDRSQDDRVVGAACWHVYRENPYAAGEEVECTWWPEGEDREMANALMGQFLTPRTRFMGKPHMFLDICFVHPEARRHGVGRMMMDWGLKKADELGLETYIDATDVGVPLYESYGFIKADKVEFKAPRASSTVRWKELQDMLLPFTFWPMWRPVKGQYEEENTSPPWADANFPIEEYSVGVKLHTDVGVLLRETTTEVLCPISVTELATSRRDDPIHCNSYIGL